MKLGKYMVAEPVGISPHEVYVIRASKQSVPLGYVEWYPRWKQYVLLPAGAGSVFAPDCLRELAAFCERLTGEASSKEKGSHER